jgi:hypothetical protein
VRGVVWLLCLDQHPTQHDVRLHINVTAHNRRTLHPPRGAYKRDGTVCDGRKAAAWEATGGHLCVLRVPTSPPFDNSAAQLVRVVRLPTWMHHANMLCVEEEL